jgi:hypothetical protein
MAAGSREARIKAGRAAGRQRRRTADATSLCPWHRNPANRKGDKKQWLKITENRRSANCSRNYQNCWQIMSTWHLTATARLIRTERSGYSE